MTPDPDIEDPQTGQPHSATRPIARRPFGPRLLGIELMHLSVLLLLPVMFAAPLRSLQGLFNDPDLWWHLADARILFTQHHFLWTEPYAYTVAGRPWFNPEWLAEVPFYLGLQWLGALGIYLVTWAAIYANVALAYLRSHRKAGPQPAFWASLGGMLLLTINSGPRTIQFGYVLLSLLLLLLDLYEEKRSRAIWLAPVIFCVWVNTHGSWLLGLILFVLYLVPGWFPVHAGALEQEKRTAAEQKTLASVLVLSVAALFVNPYGWRLVWNPFDMILHQKLNIASITEWQPLNVEWAVGKVAVAILCAMLLASLLKPRKWQVYEILFLIFAWYSAFDHVRFACLAGIIVTPFLAVDFARLLWPDRPKTEFPVLNAIFAAGVVALLAYIIPSAKQDAEAMRKWPDSLIGMVQPQWRTFNDYQLGGRFAFEGKPDFVDSRVDTFEHAGVFGDYLDAVNIQKPFEILDKYKIDHILLPEKSPLVYLAERSPQWTVVKREQDWVLLERKK